MLTVGHLRFIDHRIKAVFERASIEQTRQGIIQAFEMQLAAQLAIFGDILEDKYMSDRLGLLVDHRRSHHLQLDSHTITLKKQIDQLMRGFQQLLQIGDMRR